MKKLYIIIIIFFYSMSNVNAQYTIDNFRTAVQLAEQLQGEGITILNPQILCKDSFLGTFSGMGLLGFDEGIVLANNHTDRIFTDYDVSFAPRNFEPFINFNVADTLFMNKIIKDWGVPYPYGLVSNGACVFHFDFVPQNDSISLNFVFTDLRMDLSDYSETETVHLGGSSNPFRGFSEYSYRMSPRCNAIGILLTGSEYEDTINLAVYEDERNVPVNMYSLMVDSIFVRLPPTTGTYAYDTAWWRQKNRGYNLIGNLGGSYMPYFNYPMLTRVFRASAGVKACDTFHLALGITSTRSQPGTGPGAGTSYDYGGSAIFFDKLVSEGKNSQGCEDTTTSVLPVKREENFCTVYPNPFSSKIQLKISDGQSRSAVYRVRIKDVLGRQYYEQEGSITAINRGLATVGDGLVNGVYVLSVEDVKSQKTNFIKIVRE